MVRGSACSMIPFTIAFVLQLHREERCSGGIRSVGVVVMERE